MDIKKLQALVVDALEDVKAQDIRIYETSHLTSLFDRIAIASGTSNRQTKALAASVRDKVKGAGGQVLAGRCFNGFHEPCNQKPDQGGQARNKGDRSRRWPQ